MRRSVRSVKAGTPYLYEYGGRDEGLSVDLELAVSVSVDPIVCSNLMTWCTRIM
jgi:hypothetical protein